MGDIKLLNEYCVYSAYQYYSHDMLEYLWCLAPIDTGELREKLYIDFYIEDGECVFIAGSGVHYYKYAMAYQRENGALFDTLPRDSVADTWKFFQPLLFEKAQLIKVEMVTKIARAQANRIIEETLRGVDIQ